MHLFAEQHKPKIPFLKEMERKKENKNEAETGRKKRPVIISRVLDLPTSKTNFNNASSRIGNQQNQQQKPPHRSGLQPNCATQQNYSCGSPRERNIVSDSSKHNISKAAIPGNIAAQRVASG